MDDGAAFAVAIIMLGAIASFILLSLMDVIPGMK